MKKIGALQLGLSFAGCILGAGFVSGQELWQFFGSFGRSGVLGLMAAVLIIIAVGIVMLKVSRLTGFDEADKIVAGKGHTAIRTAVTVLSLLFLFGVGTIMTAGAGASASTLFGISPWVGSLVFVAAVAAVSLAGLSGMVSVFSATVPLLAAFSLAFGIYALRLYGFELLTQGDTNPLMSSWVIAALSFACYNLFASLAVIAPFGRNIKSKSSVILGVAIGGALLLTVAGSVLICVSADTEFSSAELPMLAFAKSISPLFGSVYGVLLLLAMFGTAVSSSVAFTNALKIKASLSEKRRSILVLLTAALMFGGSLFGFGDLIGLIYPVFGYCSSVFMVIMIIHYIKLKRRGVTVDE